VLNNGSIVGMFARADQYLDAIGFYVLPFWLFLAVLGSIDRSTGRREPPLVFVVRRIDHAPVRACWWWSMCRVLTFDDPCMFPIPFCWPDMHTTAIWNNKNDSCVFFSSCLDWVWWLDWIIKTLGFLFFWDYN
jgi:hypothetical protein